MSLFSGGSFNSCSAIVKCTFHGEGGDKGGDEGGDEDGGGGGSVAKRSSKVL